MISYTLQNSVGKMKGLGNVHLESRESFVNKPKRINQHEIYPKLYTVTKNDHHAAKDIGTIQYFQKFYIRTMIVSSNYKKKKKKKLHDDGTPRRSHRNCYFSACFILRLFCPRTPKTEKPWTRGSSVESDVFVTINSTFCRPIFKFYPFHLSKCPTPVNVPNPKSVATLFLANASLFTRSRTSYCGRLPLW